MRKNRTAKMGIVVAILLLTVAFAVISTTLTINGTASVKSNNAEFEEKIVFSNAEATKPYLLVNDSEEKTAVTVAADRKSISFTVPAFDTVGNHAVLHYWITNESTNYDATLGSLVCKVKDSTGNETTEYITATPANGFNGKQLKKGATTESDDTVDVKMVKSYAGETAAEYTVECTITATGSEA